MSRAAIALFCAMLGSSCTSTGGAAGRSSAALRPLAPTRPTLRDARRMDLLAMLEDDARASSGAISAADWRLVSEIVDRGLRRFEQDDPGGERWGEAKVRFTQLLREARRPSDAPDEDAAPAGQPVQGQGIVAAIGGDGCRYWPFCP
jgi:hypothetical protein